MSKFRIFLAAVAAVAVATPAMSATFELHGDLNNRFNLYTNQAQMFNSVEGVQRSTQLGAATGAINEDGVDEFFADYKYRLESTMATNDGAVKGVFAIEVGGQQYGSGNSADFSGDGTDVEVRKAYTDFQLPNMTQKARVSLGLQALTVNKFVWWETVPSVQFKSTAGAIDYTLAWARGLEAFNNDEDDSLFEDLDALVVRGDMKPAENVKAGVFLLYQHINNDDDGATTTNAYEVKQIKNAQANLYTIGTDGSFTTPTPYGNGFVNWDLIYQGGTVNKPGDLDVSSFLIHADAGVNVGATRFTYTGWYASGDDNPNDGDLENFLATDVDRFDSIIFFEGGYTDDDYFTEAPYILDKGLILNKLAVDHKLSEKTNIGAALLYLMTAEDLTLADGSKEDTLGTEIDAYISHKLYDNLEVAVNAGYLLADDGMDFWETAASADGDSDADVFRSTARIRYKF